MSTQTRTVQRCYSCGHYMHSKDKCFYGVSNKINCSCWVEAVKWKLMREKTQEQVKISQWNTKEHRRLELS